MLSGGAGDLEPESVQGPRFQAFHHVLGRVAPRREGDRGEDSRSWRRRPLELLEGQAEGFLSTDSPPSMELTWMAGRRSPWADLLGTEDKPGVRSCPPGALHPSLPPAGRTRSWPVTVYSKPPHENLQAVDLQRHERVFTCPVMPVVSSRVWRTLSRVCTLHRRPCSCVLLFA